MGPPVDTSGFEADPWAATEPDEEDRLLRDLAEKARAFIQSFHWAPPIGDVIMAFGIGKVIGLFLVRFPYGLAGEGEGDTELWVVVGDIPSIYFETEDARTPAVALGLYCAIAEDWADSVLAHQDLSDCYPIEAPPTRANAEMLKRRIGFIREELIPEALKRSASSLAREFKPLERES